ncbi:hypothetical protein OQJ46_10550 [Microbulbifer thermotolerans]|nr:hypothetical protein [Microbulbifer thermotolerans]MCX2783426.1 hypothetical protein [Microbulbifer thermotolerans]SFC87297.1 hypothetical protein SAMN05660479_02604 [Microbulbifer thermotolerans]
MWPHFEPGKSEVRVDKVLVKGEGAVIIGHFTQLVTRTGKKLSTLLVMHLRIQEGEVICLHLYEDTLEIARTFDMGARGPQ